MFFKKYQTATRVIKEKPTADVGCAIFYPRVSGLLTIFITLNGHMLNYQAE